MLTITINIYHHNNILSMYTQHCQHINSDGGGNGGDGDGNYSRQFPL